MHLLPLLTAAISAWTFAVSSPQEPAPPSGAERLFAQLRDIRTDARKSNLYLGEDVVDRLSARLRDRSRALNPNERFQVLSDLAREELRIGRVAEAVGHYEAALVLLQEQKSGVPQKAIATTRFQLGVACMRLGEVNNCCNLRTPQSCILPISGAGIHTDQAGSLRAIAEFEALLATVPPGSPLALKARWALNIAAMTVGTWPDEIQESERIPPSVFASDEEFPRFAEVAQAKGLDAVGLAGAAIAEDFTGDGLVDLMTTNSEVGGSMRLFRQERDGSWSERTAGAGLEEEWGGLNAVQADYDNDGDVDVLVLRGAWWSASGRHPNSLLRNDGGRFTDVTYAAGLGAKNYPTQTAAWADYDNDGDLDCYVGNESDPECPSPGQLLQNQGDGTFVDVAGAAGVSNDRYAKGVVWGDFDEDGWQDLFISNMASANRLYRNRGDGSFEDVAATAGVALPLSSFACFAWDFDQDGHLDLWVGSYGSTERPPSVADVAASYLGLPQRAEPPRLYRGDGAGRFEDVAEAYGIRLVTVPMGCNFGDLDNDGYPDFYLATGYPLYEGLVPNVMYHNLAGKGFANVTTAGGFGHLQKGHGVAFADLDGDGDQDVFTRMGGSYPGDAYGNVFFENPGFGNHWLKVRLVGKRSNRFGVGVRLEVEIHEAGALRTIYATVGTGGSFGGNPLRQELGLGQVRGLVRLRVIWPASGAVQVFEGVPPDSNLRITEFASALELLSG